MIKSSILVKRKEGMSVADFQSRWLGEHAQMATKIPGLKRYVLCPTLLEEYDREEAPDYDGVAEMWWEDKPALDKALASPEMQAVMADAATFTSEMMPLHATEVTLKDALPTPAERKGMVKYIAMLYLKDGVPVAEFQRHWKDVHGPINVHNITRMKRYVQSHVLPEMFEGASPPPFAGLPEAWFDSVADMRGAPRNPDAKQDTNWPNVCSGQRAIFAREVVVVE